MSPAGTGRLLSTARGRPLALRRCGLPLGERRLLLLLNGLLLLHAITVGLERRLAMRSLGRGLLARLLLVRLGRVERRLAAGGVGLGPLREDGLLLLLDAITVGLEHSL